MSVAELKGVDLFYDGRQVLHRVDLTLERGEFLVVIGPNGSGKTSLLKAMAGLVRAAGKIEILGKSLTSYSRRELARQLAVVPQQPPMDFPFTVAETVLMGRAPYLGLLEAEKERDLELARRAMEFTAIDHLADRRLDELSGGERQRVLIARAVCQEPRLILLDEPTASLDPAHQVKIMDLMENLRRESGVTVIMVSHDLNLASMYGSRLLLLSGGRVAAEGSPAEVLAVDRLEGSYGCRMVVERSGPGGTLRVFPLSGHHRERVER